MLLSELDATSSGELIEDAELARLDVLWDEVSNCAMVQARIRRLGRRIERALARLERRRGPEPSISLKWLVWCLCDLYRRETGQPVTSSAVADYVYTGSPQSPAGKFVVAAVLILRPSEAWTREPDHLLAPSRNRSFGEVSVRRAVYSVMRDYVAAHPRRGNRPGRRKRVG
jgi:hypothetical protein